MQAVLVHQCFESSPHTIIIDRRPIPPITTSAPAHAQYIDGFLVIATTIRQSRQLGTDIDASLNGKGLPTHPTNTSSRLVFTGLAFDGESCTVRVDPTTGHRLRFGIKRILRLGRIRGSILESVIGHYTWIGLLCRPSLCVFRHAYSFVRQLGTDVGVIPPAMRKEFELPAGLIPLMFLRMRFPRDSQVYCSDLSEYGYGVCRRFVDAVCVGRWGEAIGQTKI
jgi:hypothetical protein